MVANMISKEQTLFWEQRSACAEGKNSHTPAESRCCSATIGIEKARSFDEIANTILLVHGERICLFRRIASYQSFYYQISIRNQFSLQCTGGTVGLQTYSHLEFRA